MTFLLIVEDELPIRELVSFVCEREGFEVVGAADVGEACAALKARRPDLILLDRMLPDRSGQSWLEDLKKNPETAGLPVIMLTARGEERDRVEALDAGADDYIVKPFFPRELVARIRAVLRRQGQEKARVERCEENVVRCGPLVMNEARFEASVDGVPVKLSGKEFRLLHLFASHPGRVFSRAQLLEAVWESVYVDERTVDVHMLRLRKALAGTAAEDLIETVRGVGYRCRGL
jgi:two-component system phosphate regulon response regulator PhoB